MAIPAQFIDELTARCDIADVVADYVSLTPKGGSLWGLCPFHGERTPSFHVVPEKQIYHCFGCGKGGGVINFVMEIENLPFPDAVRLLAKRAGLEVPEERGSADLRKKRERLLALNKEAARFFHAKLRSPEGAAGAEYLFRKRGLSQGIVTRFGLGVAPDGWDNLIRAMQEKGYTKRELLDAGLAVDNKKGRVYDRFRNRVMFPIIDLRGEVIGFGGRVLDDSTPKYLNSPDTVIYNKSRNLFALNIAKKSKLGRIILTEGYMDTISLHQAGFDCAVASLGTSLTAEHAQLQPREYGIRYANMRSGRAEEGVLRLMLLEPGLFRETGSLTAEQFSVPVLGKVYGLLQKRFREGRSTQLAALAGELTPEEMSHLAAILDRPEDLANSQQALRDYISIIQTEALKRTGENQMDPLLAAREKYREKKAYGG